MDNKVEAVIESAVSSNNVGYKGSVFNTPINAELPRSVPSKRMPAKQASNKLKVRRGIDDFRLCKELGLTLEEFREMC